MLLLLGIFNCQSDAGGDGVCWVRSPYLRVNYYFHIYCYCGGITKSCNGEFDWAGADHAIDDAHHKPCAKVIGCGLFTAPCCKFYGDMTEKEFKDKYLN